jgi:hypothetical protein
LFSTSSFEYVSIEDCLDFVLSHLEEPHFPRRISTYLTEKNPPWQVSVSSKDEALEMFRKSNLRNCRISAYKFPVPTVRGINAQITNFFLSDLDMKDFKTYKALLQCLHQTLENFKVKLHGAMPTVLWSGGGYHPLQPLDSDVILEMESIFSRFSEPSRKLMRFAEMEMTNGLADSNHYPSFGNCMVRIPGSFNTKYARFGNKDEILDMPPQSEVKIVQRWDGYRPSIKWLLKDYWVYLLQEKNNQALDDLHREQKSIRRNRITPSSNQVNKIGWIESLYTKPLDDFREFCVWRIFAPYFINIRRLSQSEVSSLIRNWLERCSCLKRLNFNAEHKIRYVLGNVKHFYPIGPIELRLAKPEIYTRFRNEGIIY